MKKPDKGKGYTVRIDGKKCLAAGILQKQVEAAQTQFEELQRQNELLRTKEAMQLQALAGWEALLQQLAAVPDATATDEERAQKLVTAAMLDMQALELTQKVRPAFAASASASGSASGTPSTTATPAAANTPADASTDPSSATVEETDASTRPDTSSSSMGGRASDSPAGASNSASSSMGDELMPGGRGRLSHLMAMLDANEIPAIKQMSLAEMAGRVRCELDKVRTAIEQAEDPMADAGVVLAMRAYAKVVIGHGVANVDRHTQLYTINLETLQPELPSEDHIANIVKAAQLQPQQEQRICMAFHTNSQSEAPLLRQQQKIREQLQALLAPVALPAAADSTCDHSAPNPGAGSSQGAVSTDAAADAAATAVAEAGVGCSEAHSVRDKAAALLAVVSGGQQGLSSGDLAWLTKAGVDVGSNLQQTKELAAAGCLSVQDATMVEALLEQFSKLIFAQQQQARTLTIAWVNLLTPEQQAAAAMAAYPYMVHQPRVCAKVAAMYAAADTQP